MKELLDIYIIFAKMGAVCFGGGYAMLPILQREIVEKRGWSTEEEMLDYYAIGQCTPGVIAVNTSTFIGYKRKGILGGIIATLGFVTPSLIIILIIASVLQNFTHYPVVQHAFGGIRVCVCILIISAVSKLWKNAMVDKKSVLIFFVVLALTNFTNISSMIFILLSGMVGLFMGKLGGDKK